MLDYFSSLAITTSIILNVLLGISQLIGVLSKRRLLLGIIFLLIAYLNYHLKLLITKDLINMPIHFLFYIPALLLLGPFLRLFFHDLQETTPFYFKKEAPYFIPFLVSILSSPYIIFMNKVEKNLLIKTLYISPSTSIYSIISLSAIFIFSIYIITIVRIQPNYFKEKTSSTHKTLFTLFSISLSIFIVILLMLSLLFGSLTILKLGTIIFFIPFIVSFIFYLRHPKIFEKWTEDIQIKHYEKTHLNNMDIPDLLDDLIELLDIEKVYKDPELSLNKLAIQLDINPHQLSELINQNLNKNFSQLINEYRIKDAKKILKEDHIHTVLSIAFKVGFNSYSSFYQHFKDETGLSPAHYRKKYDSQTN